jgi:hypothetical protein
MDFAPPVQLEAEFLFCTLVKKLQTVLFPTELLLLLLLLLLLPLLISHVQESSLLMKHSDGASEQIKGHEENIQVVCVRHIEHPRRSPHVLFLQEGLPQFLLLSLWKLVQ